MRVRQGFAAAAAICAVVLIGFLVTAILFATAQETRATAAEILDAQALGVAERAAVTAAGSWNCDDCDLLPAGSVIIQNQPASQTLESTTYVTRLDSIVFLITGEARSRASGAAPIRRRVSIAVQLTRDSTGVVRALPLRSQFWSAVYAP